MATDSGTILLVEDNPRDEELTLLAFEECNLANAVVVARDGAEALDYLFGTGTYHGRAVEDLPHVVLLDLKLPKLDGLAVLARIRADPRTALLPVTVLTSSDEERDLLRSYELGVNAYIQKPVDFDQFIKATKTLGLFWAVLNRVAYRKQAP
jgi:two-component system response regulator